ncbi:MAG: response regulator transcription factor [Desulfofustis sp.]|jgi:two-component system alkaline phosphatase synthesis response regulator PhoP|nr:response regulator transcription factor [Desulfofustis sp.]
MGKVHILIVEDEAAIQQLVSYNLIKAGFNVSCADSGEEALEFLLREDIDCVLLDLMLPGMSGLEVCETIRRKSKQHGRYIPIVMLTAKGEEEDIVSGLEYGADDYITKPFSPKVLIARLKAVLRRGFEKQKAESPGDTAIIRVDELEINRGRHEVRLHGELLQLTMTEFGILALLAGKPGWVFTRQQIIDSVRGYDFLITPRAVDVQIFGLRKKMGDSGSLIETVRGVGYRFRSGS